MTFEINGAHGRYDGYINDDSVRYGRNAADNHKALIISTAEAGMKGEAPILDFMPTEQALDNNIKKIHAFVEDNDKYLKSLPPIEYEYRYMPKPKDGKIDKKALLAAAYEEMGTDSIPVKDFDENILPGKEYTSKPLDLNKDGNIDVSEYAACMLAADMFSKSNPVVESIDGSMNAKGMNIVTEYARISNSEAASKLYSQIYAKHTLNTLA